eukprot:GHVL01036441.1.p1 GENE.GHVL01036441.1~~GHVL01036441.1.p1  ORF type:complete len:454 (-),score=77.37 GHVL01036441.1:247-1608(-)
MPLDIRYFRVQEGGNPDQIKSSEIKRGRDGSIVDKVIEIDQSWKSNTHKLEQIRSLFNAANKSIGQRKKIDSKDPCDDIKADADRIKKEIPVQETLVQEISAERNELLKSVGNIVLPDVPISKDEASNKVVKRWGIPRKIKCDGSPGKRFHHQLLQMIKGFDAQRGVNIVGHRGYFMRGMGVRLNFALYSYGLNFLISRGYMPVQPPYFMNRSVMAETAELADFEETLYKIEGKKGDDGEEDKFLIATSEQPISAYHRGEHLSNFPIKYVGMSSCFRKEAGAHGKDTWGLFRIHQFEKIEQFCITDSSLEESDKMHEEMLKTCEEFYQSLELPYQVVAIVSGALNDAAAKKYDLEAWFPGYEAYRELVSCSNCTDYQSRALGIKAGFKKQGEREQQQFVHMLNGTLCATQRCMCCILENYQNESGVRVPRVLQPYMQGLEFIPFEEPLAKPGS